MKGLRKYLSPFTPDISGAVAVLYDLGGMIVISDAGGCTGNVCGFDEPRWFVRRSAVFSAGLRDIDAILGRDDRLTAKIAAAAKHISASFIAVVGTPVPAVIATDYTAVRRLAGKSTGLPVMTIPTNGMELYDKGVEAAFSALFEKFAKDGETSAESFTGIIGATPLDVPAMDSLEHLSKSFGKSGKKVKIYGNGGIDEIRSARSASVNMVVSPAGLAPARDLKKHFGTPYIAGYPADGFDAERFAAAHAGKRLLIVHQQFMANSVREKLRKTGHFEKLSTASWFMMDPEFMEDGDARLAEEDDLQETVRAGGYDTVMADPLMKKTLPGWDGDFVPMPHYAVSGAMYENENEEDFWRNMYERNR